MQNPYGALPARFRRPRLLIVGCGDVGVRVLRALSQRTGAPRLRVLALTSSPARVPALRALGAQPLLGNLDLFRIWQVAHTAIGIAVVARVSKGTGILVAIIMVGIGAIGVLPSKLAPPFSFAMRLLASSSLLTKMWRAWYSLSPYKAFMRVYSALTSDSLTGFLLM